MSVLTLCSTKQLGIHVVELDAGEQALRSSWEADNEEYGDDRADLLMAEEVEEATSVSKTQLALIYSLQLAEAIVAASLQPQLYVLLRDSERCGSVNTAYWTGLVEAIFALGSIAALFWGRLGDRRGRRPLALIGLFGMSLSCVIMGFSDGIFMCALIRAFAGIMSASIRVAMSMRSIARTGSVDRADCHADTMIGDISVSSRAKAQNYSRLPLIATGGVIGPLLQAALAHRFARDSAFWQRFPILSSQMACAGLISLLFIVNLIFLKETLPLNSEFSHDEEKQTSAFSNRRGSDSCESFDEYSEQDAFLGQSLQPASRSLANDRLQPIGFSEIVRAPSLMLIVGSYSFLSLHSASFDQLLPLLGNSSIEHGGLGLPCSFISLVVLFSSICAGVVISKYFEKWVRRLGLLQLLRLCCWVFPIIYIATPLLSKPAQGSQEGVIVASATSIFAKTLVTGVAQTLVLVLVTNASPDAYSLATIMGFMQSASVLRSLAVAGTGVAFSLSSELSIQATNYGLWGTMTAMSLGGAAIAYFVCDHPTVRDYSSLLRWEVCYDSVEDLEPINEKDPEEL
ncbi:major facilitator superfamily domain-containing protein [Sphaerosporella brunnea]|uniref:Major facilitator superfamily domain-containing protein n=1 Tax=Sphaerosporella brunnea TaxID=1250544 RepID=A0A5J5EZ94_9PEZI|nr:major facilitator superfamily domain-containing protein [Sphaerosporella brunnea]